MSHLAPRTCGGLQLLPVQKRSGGFSDAYLEMGGMFELLPLNEPTLD